MFLKCELRHLKSQVWFESSQIKFDCLSFWKFRIEGGWVGNDQGPPRPVLALKLAPKRSTAQECRGYDRRLWKERGCEDDLIIHVKANWIYRPEAVRFEIKSVAPVNKALDHVSSKGATLWTVIRPSTPPMAAKGSWKPAFSAKRSSEKRIHMYFADITLDKGLLSQYQQTWKSNIKATIRRYVNVLALNSCLSFVVFHIWYKYRCKHRSAYCREYLEIDTNCTYTCCHIYKN